MKFTEKKPTEEGFYWCKPAFGHVSYLDADESIDKDKISIAQVVTMTRVSCGTTMYVRFIGHKYPHSINSPVIRNTLWGERIKG